GIDAATDWAAVHAAASPLVTALRVRGIEPMTGVFAAAAAAKDPSGPGAAMRRALQPLGAQLDERIDRMDRVPVWGAPTPEAARDVDVQWIGVGPRWCDLARCLWDVEPADQSHALTRYLRSSGLPHRRGTVRTALNDVTVA